MPSVETDWLELWRELVTAITQTTSRQSMDRYETHFRKKTHERPDPLLDFILQDVENQSTVIDVGAGNGRWAIPIAKKAKDVTAVEPWDSRLNILRQNMATANLRNIHIVQAPWEEALVEPHDIIVCAHTASTNPEFAAFIRKMERHTKKRCYLAVSLPPRNGIIGKLSLSIYGHSYDSPNAIIAYNALYSIGIYANMLVEEDIYHWVDSTFEKAFARAKRHLRLESSAAHDKLIRDTLSHHLTYTDNLYLWPDGIRSALLWWNPSPVSR